MLRTFYSAALALFLCGITASASPVVTLTLDPSSGTVSGNPGDTVGWGYTLTNNTGDFLLVANSYFCEGMQDPLSSNPLYSTCTQSLGTYNDAIGLNGTSLDASTTSLTQSYTGSGTGVGDYVINNSAIPGQSDIGSIFVIYDLFSSNPFTDQNAVQIGGDSEISAAATVQVSRVAATPEPADLAVILPALLLMAWFARRKMQTRDTVL